MANLKDICIYCPEINNDGTCEIFPHGRDESIVTLYDAIDNGYKCNILIHSSDMTVCRQCSKWDSKLKKTDLYPYGIPYKKTCELYPEGIPKYFFKETFNTHLQQDFKSFPCSGIKEQFIYCRSCKHFYGSRRNCCEIFPDGIPENFYKVNEYDHICPCKYYEPPEALILEPIWCDLCVRQTFYGVCIAYPDGISDEMYNYETYDISIFPCEEFSANEFFESDYSHDTSLNEEPLPKLYRFMCSYCLHHVSNGCPAHPHGIPSHLESVYIDTPPSCQYYERK